MDAFTLDTSGSVYLPDAPRYQLVGEISWPDLSPFVHGYVEAMFDRAYHDGVFATAMLARRRNMRLPGFSDLDPSALALILRDCENIASWLGELTREDGRRVWEHRQEGFPGPNALDDRLCAALLPLQPYLSDEGRVCLREVK